MLVRPISHVNDHPIQILVSCIRLQIFKNGHEELSFYNCLIYRAYSSTTQVRGTGKARSVKYCYSGETWLETGPS